MRKAALLAAALLLAACGRDTPRPGADADARPAPGQDRALPQHLVLATSEQAGTLAIIDADTLRVAATLPLGKRPRGVALSPDGRTAYVALSGSPAAGPGVDESKLPPPDRSADGIGVVDLSQPALVRTLRGITDPEQLAVSADGRTLYVASEDSGVLAAFDVARGEVRGTVQVGGEPEGVGTSADGRWICATSEEDATVALVDAARFEVVARVPVGERPRTCVFSHDGATLYVPGENDASLSVVDVATRKRNRTIALDGPGVRPMGLALSPDGGTAYVTGGRARRLLAVDLRKGRIASEAVVGDRPWGVALSPDGRHAYTADGPSDTISVVDTASMQVRSTVPVPGKPWGVATR